MAKENKSSKSIACAGIVHRGFESIAETEIKEILGKECEIKDKSPSVVLFNAKSPQSIAKLAYKCHSMSRVLLAFAEFKMSKTSCSAKPATPDTVSLIKKNMDEEALLFWLKNKSFRVNCEHDTDTFSSQDIAERTGALIIDKTNARADMTSPDVIVHVHICGGRCVAGIDFCGFDMSKREYKIYSHPGSLNGAVAYCLLRSAGFDKCKTILDPLCGSGIIPIEAALFASGISPNYFRKDKFAFHKLINFNLDDLEKEKKQDEEKKCPGKKTKEIAKIKNEQITSKKSAEKKDIKKPIQIFCSDHLLSCIKAAKNNAKIAGAEKLISFSKTDIDWIDTRYDEGSIDVIAANPPPDSKHANKKAVERVYKELFNQAKYVLKKNGAMAVILYQTELFKSCIGGFELFSETEIYQGKQKLFVLVLKKPQ